MALTDPTNLRIPGPTPVPPEVVEAMSQPILPHRSPEFADMFSGLLGSLKRIFNTKDDVYVIAGTGSTGWEASIVNTMSPGDKVIAAVNGNFGVRFCDVAERFDLNVVRLDIEWGKPVTPDDIKGALEEHPDAKMVQLVHNETSTGVINPMKDLGEVVRDHGALFVADSVSGAAGAPVYMDEWQCDIVFTGSQKAFMCPPGLSIMGLSDRIWDATSNAGYHRFLLDFERIREAAGRGSTPSTAPVSLLFGLKAACDMIEAEGLENLYARHKRLADLTREGIRKLGLELVAADEYASPTVTVAWTPEGVTASEIQQAMVDRHGIYIATGQGFMSDKAIRIGHMGWTHEPEMERTLEALDDVLEHVPAVVA
ncbi:MAG: alanine--glyoxylate aminotransferase family protein [Thermomicrobiales bacterium]